MNALLCLTLTEDTLAGNAQVVRTHRKHIDIAELRADFLRPSEYPALSRFPTMVDLPLVLTVRRRKDGGAFDGSEAERRQLIQNGVAGQFAYVDREDDLDDGELDRHIRTSDKRIIRSYHDFAGVPADLGKRVRGMPRSESELAKAAVMVRDMADLLVLLKTFQELDGVSKILIGMGDVGIPTRVLAPRLDSHICYCSPAAREAAPGQMSPEDLVDRYHFRSMNLDTKVFAVVGNPVMHSLSPSIHNRGYAQNGIDAVYVPFLVDQIGGFLQVADALGIQGFSVTVPHKEAVLPFLTETDETVQQVGACNTVVRGSTGWLGVNTDVEGFLRPLRKRLAGATLPGLRCTVIGAGGAARAVVHGLVRNGAQVLILNRSIPRAIQLAQQFGCAWAPLDEDGIKRMQDFCELIVQTTSVGMEPDSDRDLVATYTFAGHELVYDLVYKPRETHLLQRARRAGCTTITGDEMLYAQAYAQYQLFTGVEYPFTRDEVDRI